MIKKDEWFLSLSQEKQKALIVKDSYSVKCPYCSHCPYCGNRLPSSNEVDFYTVWTSQSKVEIDLNELQNMPHTEFSKLLKLPSLGIRRTISLPDFMKIFNPSRLTHPLDLKIRDLKFSVISEDVRNLVSMGYTKVYMIELAPGDTSISYILQGTVE